MVVFGLPVAQRPENSQQGVSPHYPDLPKKAQLRLPVWQVPTQVQFHQTLSSLLSQ